MKLMAGGNRGSAINEQRGSFIVELSLPPSMPSGMVIQIYAKFSLARQYLVASLLNYNLNRHGKRLRVGRCVIVINLILIWPMK